MKIWTWYSTCEYLTPTIEVIIEKFQSKQHFTTTFRPLTQKSMVLVYRSILLVHFVMLALICWSNFVLYFHLCPSLFYAFFLQCLQQFTFAPLLRSWKKCRTCSKLDIMCLHVLKEMRVESINNIWFIFPHTKLVVVEFNSEFRYSSTPLNLLCTKMILYMPQKRSYRIEVGILSKKSSLSAHVLLFIAHMIALFAL